MISMSGLRWVSGLTGVGALAGGLLLGPASAASRSASDWTEIGHSHPANQDTYFYDVWITGADETGS